MKTRKSLLIRAAELYYYQGFNQNDIGKTLGISRPTVSRILEEAKEEGIVQIIIHNPITKNSELSNKVRDTLNLKDAVVITGDYTYEEALQKCGEATAHFFSTIVQNNDTIGISWGRSMAHVCEALEPQDLYNVSVIQMVGSLGTGDPNMDGFELASSFSKKLSGIYSTIYAPAFITNKTVYKYLLQEPQVQSTLKKASNVDIILTGIGSLFNENSTLHQAGYLTESERQGLLKKGAVGYLLGRSFDADGNEILSDNRSPLSAPLESFKSAKWSICISAGSFKAPAITAAVKAGYINTLIIDESLALELLESKH